MNQYLITTVNGDTPIPAKYEIIKYQLIHSSLLVPPIYQPSQILELVRTIKWKSGMQSRAL